MMMKAGLLFVALVACVMTPGAFADGKSIKERLMEYREGAFTNAKVCYFD